jgi:hypothetical protein
MGGRFGRRNPHAVVCAAPDYKILRVAGHEAG